MPEGPEVRIVRDYLAGLLTGLYLQKITWMTVGRYKDGIVGYHRSKLPIRVTSVDTKGKQILVLGVDATGVFCCLLTHLGMEGRWYEIKGVPEPHTLITLQVGYGEYVIYNLGLIDTRRFSNLAILTQRQLQDKLSTIGPDWLKTGLYRIGRIGELHASEKVTREAWKARLSNSRIKRKSIGVLLLEQKWFSEVGNYLRAEVLYQARMSPFRPVGEISEKEADRLYKIIRDFIVKSYLCQGQSLYTFRVPDRIKNYTRQLKLQVYNKRTCPMGHDVAADPDGPKSNARTIHWVPELQT